MSEVAANNNVTNGDGCPKDKDRVAKPALDTKEAREARIEKTTSVQKENREAVVNEKRKESTCNPVNWEALRTDIESLVKEKACHPILVRLSWHDAGTYCDKTKSGGAHACMRFSVSGESKHGANAGLQVARDLLEPIRQKHADSGLSNADLWAYAACVAVESAGGPKVEFRFGRSDAAEAKDSAPEGRLPDGDKGASHLRDIFHRMGFSDQEIVALSGAHTLGGCHTDRSGFEGDWTAEPLKFDNSYFKDIFEKKWDPISVESTGNPQFKDAKGLMMLSTDLALKDDEKFLEVAKSYAEDEKKFFDEFSKAFQRLQELGYADLKPISA